MTARSLMHLLFNASKGLDVIRTALDLGVLETIDHGPVSLRELCARTGAKPNRMYKFLDCLESMDLVERTQASDDRLEATYRSHEPLAEAARAVLGPASIEQDRDRYEWRVMEGKLPDVLRGDLSVSSFAWPPATGEQVTGFEASMAAGCPPIAESFRAVQSVIFPRAGTGRAARWLDVGGGDGTLAANVLRNVPDVTADVYNLPSTRDLVLARARSAEMEHRMRFVPGDFLREALPGGYDVVSFVRVLHDWDERTARSLLRKGAEALAPGGWLVVSEEFRTRERLAIQFFWTWFLMGVDACESRLREVDFYLRELSALGFADIRAVPGPFDIVLARR